MPISLSSQRAALRALANLRAGALVRAGLARHLTEADLLKLQLDAAVTTLELIASDERVRDYIEARLPR